MLDGEVYAMAGASPVRAVLAANLTTAIGVRLRDLDCYVTSSQQRLKVEATGLITYADLSFVGFDEAAFRDAQIPTG